MQELERRTRAVEQLLVEASWRGIYPSLWGLTLVFGMVDPALFLAFDPRTGWIVASGCWISVALGWLCWLLERRKTLGRLRRYTTCLRAEYQILSRLQDVGSLPSEVRASSHLAAVLKRTAVVLAEAEGRSTRVPGVDATTTG